MDAKINADDLIFVSDPSVLTAEQPTARLRINTSVDPSGGIIEQMWIVQDYKNGCPGPAREEWRRVPEYNKGKYK